MNIASMLLTPLQSHLTHVTNEEHKEDMSVQRVRIFHSFSLN